MLSKAEDWRPLPLVILLLVVAVVSEAFKLRTQRITISAAFLSLVLAMTLLGPAPAALLGLMSKGVSDLARRVPLRHALVNASTYAFFPLLGGAVFELVGGPALLDTNPATYILAVFALFLATNVLNFVLIAVDVALIDGDGMVRHRVTYTASQVQSGQEVKFD